VFAPYQENLITKILGLLPLSKSLTQKVTVQASRFLLGMRSLQNIRRLALFLSFTAVNNMPRLNPRSEVVLFGTTQVITPTSLCASNGWVVKA
jgi:hypothetical protein